MIDVGCRTGRLVVALRDALGRKRGHLLGVEENRFALARAKRKARTLALVDYTNFLEAGVGDPLPAEAGSLDGAYLHFSLYKITDPELRALRLRQTHRVLKPGGFLAVLDPGPEHQGSGVVSETKDLRDRVVYGDERERWWERTVVLPFIQRFEDDIGKKAASGVYVARTRDELAAELQSAGFTDLEFDHGYGGTCHVVMARRR